MSETINGVPVPPEVEGAGREAIAAWAATQAGKKPTPKSPAPAPREEPSS